MNDPGPAPRAEERPGARAAHPAEIHPVRDHAALSPRAPLYRVLPPVGVAGAQARRRSSILAAARELVAEIGTDGVRIRPLAKRSGVTPPTIYNLVGSRAEVLHHAIEEALDAKFGFALHRAQAENINPLLAYAEAASLSIACDPDYYRQVTAASLQPGVGDALFQSVFARKAAVFLAWLEAMEDDGLLREARCGLPSVASIVARQQCVAVIAWAKCHGSLDRLEADLVQGTALVVLGIANAAEAARIETRLLH